MAVTISSTASKGNAQRKAAIRGLLTNFTNPAVLAQMVTGLTETAMVTWLFGVIGSTQDAYLAQALAYLTGTIAGRLAPAQSAVTALENTQATVRGV